MPRNGHFRRHHRFDDEATFGFPHFVFRDPEEVFREFFGGRDPFEDLLDRKLKGDKLIFVNKQLTKLYYMYLSV